ncbi:unnamed protein product [Clonostachys byssicola]|uniref:Uncharacterized protein n=1 Tax=Clonostachys byssicola TaxID=160290 RepID=A0A9N9XZ89_9HYPO|nr:unnamed protein product [Clonostachys byssicola]
MSVDLTRLTTQCRSCFSAGRGFGGSSPGVRRIAASGKIQELLDQHGAVLIREFGHPSAETFAELVGTAEQARGHHPYKQIGLAGKRNEVAKNI